MSRSVLLLISGLYGALVALTMVFATEASLKNCGVPRVDLSHVSVMQFLGVTSAVLALLSLLNRNAPNSFSLRTIVLVLALNLLAGVVLGVYHAVVLHVPMSPFFIGDSVFRLALGLGLLYHYNHETRQARLGTTMS